jgi:catechol 2,3-dioxygenase-like lactoylglutathione lyase family enzyme
MKARFVHLNVVARDWRLLAGFYQRVFGCEPIPPERHLKGEWLSRATAVPNAELDGVHLRLPGGGDDAPTLEVFQYVEELDQLPAAANRPGWGHLAFEVDDVPSFVNTVLANGGSRVGDTIQRTIHGVGIISFAYVRDPEGNIIELQQWDAPPVGGDS